MHRVSFPFFLVKTPDSAIRDLEMGMAVRLLWIALFWSSVSPAESCFARLADKAIAAFATASVRLLTPLRYEIDIEGLAPIGKRGTRGILFCPNHPAAIDPFLVLSVLGARYQARPVMLAWRAEDKWMRPIARAARVVPIPDMTLDDPENEARLDAAIEEIASGLNRGENFVFYPPGRLQNSHLERLNGTSGVERILSRAPGARVVLLREQGLYGSLSGRARTGELEPGRFALTAVASFFANAAFFIPKRRVKFTFYEPGDLLPTTRVARNRFMEDFYNEGAGPGTHVPYFFWEGNRPIPLPDPKPARLAGDPRAASEKIREEVYGELRRILIARDGVAPALADHHDLGWDLGLDSLDRIRLNAWLGRVYGFDQPCIEQYVTVGDLLVTASGQNSRRVPP